MTINLIRKFVIYLNSALLPKIRYGRPTRFVLAKVIYSFICMGVVCTLSLAFGRVNGTLYIVLMVLRVPNSSKACPVRVAPTFFRGLRPLLPFACNIGTVHRTVTNFCNSGFHGSLLVLLLYCIPVSLLVKLKLHPTLSKLGRLFSGGLTRARFVVYRPRRTRLDEDARLSVLLRTSLSVRSLHLMATRQTRGFRGGCHGVVHVNFLTVTVVPLVFLVLVFDLRSGVMFLAL